MLGLCFVELHSLLEKCSIGKSLYQFQGWAVAGIVEEGHQASLVYVSQTKRQKQRGLH